jgi:hypothetical protein
MAIKKREKESVMARVAALMVTRGGTITTRDAQLALPEIKTGNRKIFNNMVKAGKIHWVKKGTYKLN